MLRLLQRTALPHRRCSSFSTCCRIRPFADGSISSTSLLTSPLWLPPRKFRGTADRLLAELQGRPPEGVATQDKLRQRALVVLDKAQRIHNFHRNTIHALAVMLAATGIKHPNELGPHYLFRRVSATEIKLVFHIHRFLDPGSLLDGSAANGFYASCWAMAQADSFDAVAADPSKQVIVV